ncbi:Uncharacterised protein g11422 [Pycnogonum litorale]
MSDVEADNYIQINGSSSVIKLTRNLEETMNGVKTYQVHVHGVPPDLWYLAITLEKTKDRFMTFVKKVYNNSNFKSSKAVLHGSLFRHTCIILMQLLIVF